MARWAGTCYGYVGMRTWLHTKHAWSGCNDGCHLLGSRDRQPACMVCTIQLMLPLCHTCRAVPCRAGPQVLCVLPHQRPLQDPAHPAVGGWGSRLGCWGRRWGRRWGCWGQAPWLPAVAAMAGGSMSCTDAQTAAHPVEGPVQLGRKPGTMARCHPAALRCSGRRWEQGRELLAMKAPDAAWLGRRQAAAGRDTSPSAWVQA